ncbi:MAG: twin-arginine translocase subunit TatC [Pseudomonadota bacterium]
MSNKETANEELAEGTLLSHLVELRGRLIKASVAILVFFVPLVPFYQRLFDLAAIPALAAIPNGELIAINGLAVVFTPFKLAFYFALLLAMPVILYQLWAFIAPGLYKKEKRFAFPLLLTSIVLFYLGAAFAYFVVAPLIFNFVALIAEQSGSIQLMPDVVPYVQLLISLVLVFGFAFEVPIAAVLLVWTGLVSVEKLKSVRPYVFLGAFVIGMFLTPPDVISQTLLAVPVYLLYELGILMSRLFSPKRKADEDPVTEGEQA